MTAAEVNLATKSAASMPLAFYRRRRGLSARSRISAMAPCPWPQLRRHAEAGERADARELSAKHHAMVALALVSPFLLAMAGQLLGFDLMPSPPFQFVLATVVEFYLGARFYRSAWKALRSGVATMTARRAGDDRSLRPQRLSLDRSSRAWPGARTSPLLRIQFGGHRIRASGNGWRNVQRAKRRRHQSAGQASAEHRARTPTMGSRWKPRSRM